MINLAAVRVVAFSRKNEAIHIHPDDWKVDLYGNKVTLKGGGTKIRYDLSTDILCIYVTDRIEETAIGKTVKRAALSGIAARMLSPGKGMGGAMMDLALRGAETRVIVYARMVMKDTTSLKFEATEQEYEKFVSGLPSHVQSDEAIDQSKKMISLADRMAVDGSRSFAEVDSKIASLQEKQIQARQRATSDGSFEARDNARMKERNVADEIEHKLQLKKAAMHRLSAPPILKRRVSLFKIIAASVTIMFVGIFIFGLLNGGSQDLTSDPVQPVVATSTPAIQVRKEAAHSDTSSQLPRISKMANVPAGSEIANSAPVHVVSAPIVQDGHSTGPSFDCSKATTHVEKMICTDPRLSSEDEMLAQIYRKALAASVNRDVLKADQIRWIITERNACSDPTSLLDVYQAREKQLQRMISQSKQAS